jgi:hypothetical protein
VFAWPILGVNSRIPRRGDHDSSSGAVQLAWLRVAMEDGSSRRESYLRRIMAALESTRHRSIAATRVYVSAEAVVRLPG